MQLLWAREVLANKKEQKLGKFAVLPNKSESNST
jgi:hypothetical protein